MTRSKQAARRLPKSAKKSENGIKAGKIEKQNHQTIKGKTDLKNAANEAKKEKVRPVSKKKKSEMKAARESLASGELAAEDQVRRAQRDLCSLYIRFKDKKALPENVDELKKMHEDIQIVRVPRQARKSYLLHFLNLAQKQSVRRLR